MKQPPTGEDRRGVFSKTKHPYQNGYENWRKGGFGPRYRLDPIRKNVQHLPIPNFDHYEITEAGDVWRIGNKPGTGGYLPRTLMVCLWKGSVKYKLFLAKLVAKTFIPSKFRSKELVFIDGNPKNVHVSNLKWVKNEHPRKSTSTVSVRPLTKVNRKAASPLSFNED